LTLQPIKGIGASVGLFCGSDKITSEKFGVTGESKKMQKREKTSQINPAEEPPPRWKHEKSARCFNKTTMHKLPGTVSWREIEP
jgi:hypothetical protein